MPTNKELIDELKGLGVTPSPDANNAQLKKLLKEAKGLQDDKSAPAGNALTPPPKSAEEQIEQNATPPRITNDDKDEEVEAGNSLTPPPAPADTESAPARIESKDADKQPAETEPEDYLRQYQYRKDTKFGSPESDPQPGTKAELMKNMLLKQPKVRIFIPRVQGEDKSILQSVTLNGYRLDLPKNAYIDLPKQIADVLMESLQQTEKAILTGQIAGNKEKETALT